MPPIVPDNAKPSTLSAVLRQVRDAFDAMGDATIVQVGAQFREGFGVGGPFRVLFVPETKGSVDDPIEMGNAASLRHGCDLYLRAEIETSDDVSRFDPVVDLAALVIDLIHTAAPGRITWGTCDDDSPVNTDTGMGAGLAIHFEYRHDVRHDARRWVAGIITASGPKPGPMTPAPDLSTPSLPSAPGATYANAADPSVTVTLVP